MKNGECKTENTAMIINSSFFFSKQNEDLIKITKMIVNAPETQNHVTES